MNSETKSSAIELPEIKTKTPIHYLFSFRWRRNRGCDCRGNDSPCNCSPRMINGDENHGLFITKKNPPLSPGEVMDFIRERIHTLPEFEYCGEIMIWNLHSRDPELKDDESAYDLVIKGKNAKYND